MVVPKILRTEIEQDRLFAGCQHNHMTSALDRAADSLHRTRADVIRQAIDSYLEDFNDISLAIDRLRDPADESIDWQEARRALLAED